MSPNFFAFLFTATSWARAQTTSSLTPSSYVGLEPTEEGEKRDKIDAFPLTAYLLSDEVKGMKA